MQNAMQNGVNSTEYIGQKDAMSTMLHNFVGVPNGNQTHDFP